MQLYIWYSRPTVHQSPEVRPRATARGPARSIQPGHIEFGTGNWVLLVCFDGNRFRHDSLTRFSQTWRWVLDAMSAVVVNVVVSTVVVSVVVSMSSCEFTALVWINHIRPNVGYAINYLPRFASTKWLPVVREMFHIIPCITRRVADGARANGSIWLCNSAAAVRMNF